MEVSSDPGRYICNWIYYRSLSSTCSTATVSQQVHTTATAAARTRSPAAEGQGAAHSTAAAGSSSPAAEGQGAAHSTAAAGSSSPAAEGGGGQGGIGEEGEGPSFRLSGGKATSGAGLEQPGSSGSVLAGPLQHVAPARGPVPHLQCSGSHSLFVHVPPLACVGEELQRDFALRLMEAVARMVSRGVGRGGAGSIVWM